MNGCPVKGDERDGTPPFLKQIIYWLVFIRQGSIIEMTKKMHRYTVVSVWGHEFQPNTWHPFSPGLSIKKTLVSLERRPHSRLSATVPEWVDQRCAALSTSSTCHRSGRLWPEATPLFITSALYTRTHRHKHTVSYTWLHSLPWVHHFCFVFFV